MSTSERPRALVTGAARGIGAACAAALADAGFAVVLADICHDVPGAGHRQATQTDLDSATARCGPAATAVRCDVRIEDDVRAAVAACDGRLDALVAAAGVLGPGSGVEHIPDEGWATVFDVNVTGMMRCVRAAAPLLRASGRGRVVGIASSGALVGAPLLSPYTASKAAVLGFLRSVAAELAGDAVTVNAVCPGSVPGPMLDACVDVYGLASPEEFGRHHLTGRLLQAEQVAALVAFLCGDAASGITGAVLPADAGLTSR